MDVCPPKAKVTRSNRVGCAILSKILAAKSLVGPNAFSGMRLRLAVGRFVSTAKRRLLGGANTPARIARLSRQVDCDLLAGDGVENGHWTPTFWPAHSNAFTREETVQSPLCSRDPSRRVRISTRADDEQS
jgi:hypothetical protein